MGFRPLDVFGFRALSLWFTGLRALQFRTESVRA